MGDINEFFDLPPILQPLDNFSIAYPKDKLCINYTCCPEHNISETLSRGCKIGRKLIMYG